MAALMGAEEYGVATTSMVAMGCILVRQCHSNTCPVGICTQDPALRDKFEGTPEKVVNLFSFMAEEVREILASLGASSLTELIGRTDLLAQVSRGSPHLDDLDLNSLLVQADHGPYAPYCTREGRNEVPDTLDAQMIGDTMRVFEVGEKMQLAYTVRNTERAIGTRLVLEDRAPIRHDRPQARAHHGAPARLRRPVARRLRRAGPEARGLRRSQ